MDYIKVKGESLPFWFALKAQIELARSESAGKDNLYLIWLGLKYGAIKEGKEFTMLESDILDAFEDDIDEYHAAG